MPPAARRYPAGPQTPGSRLGSVPGNRFPGGDHRAEDEHGHDGHAPGVMADSGPPSGPARPWYRSPRSPACRLPGCGPASGHDRAQSCWICSLWRALNGLDRAEATPADAGAAHPTDLEDALDRRLGAGWWRCRTRGRLDADCPVRGRLPGMERSPEIRHPRRQTAGCAQAVRAGSGSFQVAKRNPKLRWRARPGACAYPRASSAAWPPGRRARLGPALARVRCRSWSGHRGVR